MIKNSKACSTRRLCHDHKMNYNGGCAYETFHLSDKMRCVGHCKKRTKVFILAPSMSDDNGKHNRRRDLCHLKWEEHKWRHKQKICEKKVKHDTLMTIFLPKFMNRCSFVSSCAWLINLFCATRGLKRCHAMQLLCVALLTPSQTQFQLVVRHLMKEFTPETNLCFDCLKHCKENGLCANGGPEPRFMAGKESELPAGMKEVEKNLGQIERAINSLNSGGMLNEKGVFVDNKTVVDVKGVGPARAISFPSLCCFIGLGTSEHAIQTAKQAILNSETGNGHAGDKHNEPSKLGSKLKVHGDSLPYKDSYYHSILEAAGKSVGEVHSTMENSSCAITRTLGRHDMFVKGQTLHCLFLDIDALNTNGGDETNASKVRSTVCEKKIGTKKWSEANLPQWTSQSFSHH